MKKWFFLLISLPVIIISCSKGDESACGFSDSGASASAVEISYIQNYLSANSLTATQHSSGLFYTIDDPGTFNTAAICSNVTVNYTGSLMANGVVFDSNNSGAGISFILGQLIVGWQKGIPKFGRGGKGKLFIPSKFAYGKSSTPGRASAVLGFDVEVHNF